MQFIKIVDNSRSWRVFSLCSNSSPFFLSFSVSISVYKNRNEAAAAAASAATPPGPRPPRPAQLAPRTANQSASQPARALVFSHPRKRAPPLDPRHVVRSAPLVSASPGSRTHLFPLLSPSPWGPRARARVSSHRSP